MAQKSKRRWFAVRLRTMFVLVFVVSLPLAWVGYSLNWIRQRHEVLDRDEAKFVTRYDHVRSTSVLAPGGLWLFGETGVVMIQYAEASPELMRSSATLFPE